MFRAGLLRRAHNATFPIVSSQAHSAPSLLRSSLCCTVTNTKKMMMNTAVATVSSVRYASSKGKNSGVEEDGEVGSPSTNSTITGSSTLHVSQASLEAESKALLDAASDPSNVNHEIEKVILTFNALRRYHMLERKSAKKKHIEAQAWRTIQSLQPSDVEKASDYGAAVVVSAWAYFSKQWENGLRGPTTAAAMADSAENNRLLGDAAALAAELEKAYPSANDVKVVLDHNAALIHEVDLFTINDDADEGLDGEGAGGAAASSSDEHDDDLSSLDVGGAEHDDDVSPPAGARNQQRRHHGDNHPRHQQSGEFTSSSSSTSAGSNNNNSNAASSAGPTQRKILRRKTAPAASEVIEAPRAEVLDEVFE